ncbi:MAG: enoyl-CoA hydratase/isomerase family protein [Candidatus Eremiobacteraeota bacterium]|nr:enoyl-CoA hydratase/isomerase family protein [Candidatus Eremiobacteraeota bacterium]MBV8499208.1 enoyl-CoA hydratase/isomerase family protein [Candidatus Eremiobacteraeota bacterium]
MSFEDILAVVEAPIGIITFNRPNVLNALRSRLLREVSDALDQMERNEAVRAVVVTGAGEKAFAAGADISELSALATAGSGAEQARRGQAVTRQIERMRKPVIMAINGFALGGGCEIAMAGDILVASENAKFGQPEVNLGLIPGYGGSQRTTRLVGKGMASYLCLTGEMIDAREALRIGLVVRVVPPSELMAEAKRIATVIASKAPLAIAACKRVINNGAHLDLDDALELEALEFGTLVDTEDIREGTGAFLEKRKPVWKGR